MKKKIGIFLVVPSVLIIILVVFMVPTFAGSQNTFSPIKISSYNNIEQIKYQIAHNPEIQYKYAFFAHMLGYGWCSGTRSEFVGKDFDVINDGKGSYILQAHYDRNDPYASGYWAENRLKMKFSNFKVSINPSTIKYGKAKIEKLQPKSINTYMAENYSNTSDKITKSFTYQLQTTTTHTTNVQFTEGMSLKSTVKLGIPFLVEGNMEMGMTFQAAHGWSDATTKFEGTMDVSTYEGVLPPKSKREIQLVLNETKSTVPYSAVGEVTFDVTYQGFMRQSGNAKKDHPTNRPIITETFGNGTYSSGEKIRDIYNHRNNPDYSKWDFKWMESNFGESVPYIVNYISKQPVLVNINGKFAAIKGTNCNVKASEAKPIK